MPPVLKVVHSGLGPIGQGIARLILETEGLKIVAAADLSPEHAGKDLGVVLGLPRRLRVKVEGDPARFLRRARGDVAVLCTASSVRLKHRSTRAPLIRPPTSPAQASP